MVEMFTDRADAGRRLAARLRERVAGEVVVLGLPRGGVPVAAEVAAELHAPLDVVVVRKLGVPFASEVAMGAIGEEGMQLHDRSLITSLGLTWQQVDAVEQRERRILAERVALFRGERGHVDVAGRTVIIVDDGLATGATATVACRIARAWGAGHVIVAVPVGNPEAVRRVYGADEVICDLEPRDFHAVGAFYRSFDQTSESEVVSLLSTARERSSRGAR